MIVFPWTTVCEPARCNGDAGRVVKRRRPVGADPDQVEDDAVAGGTVVIEGDAVVEVPRDDVPADDVVLRAAEDRDPVVVCERDLPRCIGTDVVPLDEGAGRAVQVDAGADEPAVVRDDVLVGRLGSTHRASRAAVDEDSCAVRREAPLGSDEVARDRHVARALHMDRVAELVDGEASNGRAVRARAEDEAFDVERTGPQLDRDDRVVPSLERARVRGGP